MEQLQVTGRTREPGRPNALRVEGYVPAVLYGKNKETMTLAIDAPQVDKLMKQGGARHLLELEVEGLKEKKTVMIKEVQRDPVKGHVLHLDFYQVSLTDKIETEVPIHLVGEEAVRKSGAIIQHQLWAVEVSCLPTDIPDSIEASVEGLGPGDSITVGDLKAPENVEILNDPDEVVLSIVLPRAAAAEEAEGAEEGAQKAEEEAAETEKSEE